MKKGINQWSLPTDYQLEDQIKLATQAGFDGIELCLSEEGEFSLSTSQSELKQIKNLADGEGIELPSVATELSWNYPLTSSSEDVVQTGKEIIRTIIEHADYLGADTVLVVPGVVENPFDPQMEVVPYDKAYERSLTALRELTDFARQREVKIGIENVWNKFLLSPLEMRDFVDQIDSDYLGVYFDVGNVLQFGFPGQWIEILGDRICKVHVKDFSKDIGNLQGFTYLLQGDVNWSQVMKMFDEIKYDDYLTAEVVPPYPSHPEKLAFDTAGSMDLILEEEV